MADTLKQSSLNILGQISQEGYSIASLHLSNHSTLASNGLILVWVVMHLLLLHLHLLLIKVRIVNFPVTLLLSCRQRFTSSFH